MIITYDDMMQLCENKQEFRAKTEIVDGIEVTIFSYMVAMTDTFDSELAKEFRGTTFRNDTKECICRPFPKFFNMGEKAETHEDNIHWGNTVFYTKHDGSMATPVLLNGKIFWKTKNSFYSDVAVKIQNFWGQSTDNTIFPFLAPKALAASLELHNITPIFEYVAPHNQIVLHYAKEELKYLGYRSLETGRFSPSVTNLSIVSREDITDLEGIEGFVGYDGNQLFKIKTKWYIERHKICTEFNPKVIIQSTLDDTIDDLIGTIVQLGATDLKDPSHDQQNRLHERQKQVEDLRDEVNQTKIDVLDQIDIAWKQVMYIEDQKEFALEVQKTLDKWLWSFMFSLGKGKSISQILNKYVFNLVYDETRLRR